MATIYCENIHRRIPVPDHGVNLRSALLNEGVRVYRWPRNYRPLNCGGKGLCGTCRIEVIENGNHLSPLTGKEEAKLGLEAGRIRLSCQCLVQGDVTIRTLPQPKP